MLALTDSTVHVNSVLFGCMPGQLSVVPWEVVNTRGRKKTSGKDGVYHNTHQPGGLHVPP